MDRKNQLSHPTRGDDAGLRHGSGGHPRRQDSGNQTFLSPTARKRRFCHAASQWWLLMEKFHIYQDTTSTPCRFFSSRSDTGCAFRIPLPGRDREANCMYLPETKQSERIKIPLESLFFESDEPCRSGSRERAPRKTGMPARNCRETEMQWIPRTGRSNDQVKSRTGFPIDEAKAHSPREFSSHKQRKRIRSGENTIDFPWEKKEGAVSFYPSPPAIV